MAVFEVLPEVVRTEKLLAAVALPELMHLLKVANALFPVLVGGMPRCRGARTTTVTGELLAAVATGVRFARPVSAVVKGSIIMTER